MQQFGTPLTRGEMKQINGGNAACFDCFSGSGGHLGSVTCSSMQECAQGISDLCGGSNCSCINN